MRKLLGVLATALIAVPAAGAGGFATVGLSSLPPEDGSAWNVELTILAHGRAPVDGLTPTITIQKGDGASQTFTATPAGNAGRYQATVAFPSDGTWSYTINDGYSRTHTYAPVTISGAGEGSFTWLTTAIGTAIGLALATLLVLLARRRRPEPRLVPTH